jgi:hypothetical protein
MGEKRDAYRLLVGNPEGKRPLGYGLDWSGSGYLESSCEFIIEP